MPGRVYNTLHELAVDQNGYVTTRDARELGVVPQRLHLMVERGVLKHVGRGLFRFPDVPAGALDQYAEATLWPLECRGVLSYATALDLHALCDINPSRIDITVPRRFRTTRMLPKVLRLHREDLPDDAITWHEGLPIVTVYRAIEGSIAQGVGWNLIEQAIDTARSTGRLSATQADALRALRPTDTPAASDP